MPVLTSAQTTLVESSAIRPSVVSSDQLNMPAAQAHTSFQPLSSSNQVQFLTPIVSQPLSSSYDHKTNYGPITRTANSDVVTSL